MKKASKKKERKKNLIKMLLCPLPRKNRSKRSLLQSQKLFLKNLLRLLHQKLELLLEKELLLVL